MYKQITSNKRKSIFLIIIFIIFVLFLGWIFGETTTYGEGGIFIAIIISLGMAIGGYYGGDKVALWTANAQGVTKEENPYVYRLVENLCITAGLEVPKIFIIPDASMNAFATGRDPKHASLALTSGIIEKLENEELEGVIAHELSHIKNYDIRFATLVLVLVGVVMLLSNWLIRGQLFGFGRRSRDSEKNTLAPVIMIIGFILAILSPIIAKLIQLAISRKREFLADADSALLTRYPQALASALAKIQSDGTPLRSASDATSHLYIANPFGSKTRKISNLFSTHPPVEERIKALQNMAEAK